MVLFIGNQTDYEKCARGECLCGCSDRGMCITKVEGKHFCQSVRLSERVGCAVDSQSGISRPNPPSFPAPTAARCGSISTATKCIKMTEVR